MAIDKNNINDNFKFVNKERKSMKEFLSSVFFQALLGAITALIIARYILGYQI